MIDWRKYLAQMAFVLALFGAVFVMLFLFGCASTERIAKDERTDTRTREVTVTTSQTPVTAADGAVSLVTLTSTTTRTLTQEQVSHSDTQGDRHTAPDGAAIVATVQPIMQGAKQGFDNGGPIGGIIGAVMGGLAMWKAAQPLVKNKDQQLAERDDRLARLRTERDEARDRAEQYALKLPPPAGAA